MVNRLTYLLVVMALLAAACGGTGSNTGEGAGDGAASPADASGTAGGGGGDDPIRVGLAVSLSGAVADTGKKMRDGAQLWVDEGNTILGRPVELVVQDDESTPETSARLYDRLITQEKVDLLIGPYGSGPSAAVASVTDRHGRFIQMTGASAASIYTGSEMAVQLMSPQLHLPQLAFKLAQENDYKTVAAAAVDNAYGREVLDGIRLYAEKFGMDIVHEEVYEEEPRDLSSMILNMKQKNPDVVYVGAYVPDGILFMRQAEEQGLNAKMYVLGATGPVTQEFVDALGPTAEYVMGTAQWHPQAAYEGIEGFVQSMHDTFGDDVAVDYVHATGYAAMEVLSRIAEDAGSLEDEALLEAAHAADYQTMYGGYKLDEDGIQIAERGAITQIQDGEIVPVYPAGTDWEPMLPVPAWNER